jgi:crossover junction endodeoxyribonuclease RuvC
MLVLGIDPGTIIAGYGLVDNGRGDLKMVAYGVIKSPQKLPVPERLSKLYYGLKEVLEKYHPDVVAVEQPFVSNNVGTAFIIGRAQAVAILVAANHNIPVFEYSPAKIKQAVSSYGASSKEQIQQMVKLHLNLAEIPEPVDASDALAAAICHCNESHLSNLIEQKPKRSRK